MILIGPCTVAAVVLAMVMVALATLAVEAITVEVAVYESHDDRRAIWEEREALRLLRARYAKVLVSPEDYRRLSYELRTGHEA